MVTFDHCLPENTAIVKHYFVFLFHSFYMNHHKLIVVEVGEGPSQRNRFVS